MRTKCRAGDNGIRQKENLLKAITVAIGLLSESGY